MAEVETAPVGGKLEGHTSGGNVQTIRISAIFSNELELWFAPRGSSRSCFSSSGPRLRAWHSH
jgi:hypothetical protein